MVPGADRRALLEDAVHLFAGKGEAAVGAEARREGVAAEPPERRRSRPGQALLQGKVVFRQRLPVAGIAVLGSSVGQGRVRHKPDAPVSQPDQVGHRLVGARLVVHVHAGHGTVLQLAMQQQGKTILFSTHVMEQAEKLCDSIALIARGQVVLDGDLSSIKRRFGGRSMPRRKLARTSRPS